MWLEHCRDLQGEFFLHFPDAETFAGATKVQQSQDATVVEFVSTAIEYDRRSRHVARDGAEGIRLVTPLQGSLGLTQCRESADIPIGSVGVFDMGRPMKLVHDSGIRAIILSVPDSGITRRVVDKAPVLLPGERPLVSMLRSHMAQITTHYAQMTATEFSAGMDILARLLERVVLAEQSTNERSMADKVLRYILEHSDDPDLDLVGIATGVGYSVRYLYKVLEEKGTTPGRLLTAVRLERAVDRLRNSGRTIEEIAFESGFGSPASFRRNYLDHYGITPSRMREKLTSENAAVRDASAEHTGHQSRYQ